jgi:hypothetical protein
MDADHGEREAEMSLRNAINEKCKWCIYDPLSGEGNWRQQVTKCTSTDCPLYPVRPISKPKKEKERGTQDSGE